MQLVADLNDSPFNHALARMGQGGEAFTKGFEQQFKAMEKSIESDMDRLLRKVTADFNLAQEKMMRGARNAATEMRRQDLVTQQSTAAMLGRNSGGRGGRGGQGSYQTGQAALQAQDIAVQLEMGTNAGRVLLQQGTQLASIFGPTGAIVAGASALLAIIGAQILGINKLAAQEERLLKIARARTEVGVSLAKNAMAAIEQADDADRERFFGRDEADRMKRQEDHERRIKEIRNARGEGSMFEEEENRRYEAVEALFQHRKERENALAAEREQQQIKELEIQTKIARMVDDSPEAKMQQLEEETTDLIKQQQGKGGLEYVRLEYEIAQRQRQIYQLMMGEIKTAEDERKQAEKEVEDSLKKQASEARKIGDIFKDAEETRTKEIEKQSKLLADQMAQAQNEKNNRIAQEIQDRLDPKAKNEREKREKDIEREIRDRAGEKLDEEDRARRKSGRRELTPGEKSRRRKQLIEEGRAGVDKQGNAVSVKSEDIDKMAVKIAAEVNKLIPI